MEPVSRLRISIGPWISADLLGLLLPIALLAALALVVERVFGVDEGYPWRRSIAATGAGIVGGTLLVGAWGKMLDPVAFAQNLRLEGITSWLGSGWYPQTVPALLVIAIEVLLGSLLVLGVRYRATLIATGLLVAFFLFLTGRAMWRDAQRHRGRRRHLAAASATCSIAVRARRSSRTRCSWCPVCCWQRWRCRRNTRSDDGWRSLG